MLSLRAPVVADAVFSARAIYSSAPRHRRARLAGRRYHGWTLDLAARLLAPLDAVGRWNGVIDGLRRSAAGPGSAAIVGTAGGTREAGRSRQAVRVQASCTGRAARPDP